jgi:hypothetical protein
LASFDEGDLPRLVRYHYPLEVGKSIDWQQSLEVVANQLLNKLELRGDLEPLLRGMLQARPKKDEVLRFCRNHFPEGFQTPGQADLVTRVAGGLTTVIGALSNPKVRLTMGRFRADIDTARERIRTVAAYKVMHDSLHNLAQRLDVIVGAISNFRENPAAGRQLSRAALDLRREARRARESADRTPTKDRELSWIDDMEQSVASMQVALAANDEQQMSDAVETLQRLVVETDGINRQICAFAADLKLGILIEALAEIEKHVSENGGEGGAASRLRAGQSGLKGLQAEFARRVAEHQAWQLLDRELSAAESSSEYDPAKKIHRWPKVRDRLIDLCDLFPNEEWYVELRARSESWEKAASAGDRATSTMEANTFLALASNRFFDVDVELNTLCDRLNEVALLLDTLLEVLTHDRS